MGKSFMFNYINENYEYGVYNAGQTASLDNIVYGYDEEGAIIWDIPKSYNWDNDDIVNALASSIEKFSDFGQYLTSKKYQGKKCRSLGHTIVFSNRRPIKQLKHRDIVEIIAGELPLPDRYRIKENDGVYYLYDKWEHTTKSFYNMEDINKYIEKEEQ